MNGRKCGESESGAVAAVDIPSGSKSSPFNLSIISKRIDLDKVNFPLEVSISQSKELRPVSINELQNPSQYFWPKFIQLAPDCHHQNIKICRWQQNMIILQSTSFIRKGQQLFLWFEESILVDDLGIPPYLSPGNIRGGKSYVCHKCGNEFEVPNPLKVHIALDCGRFTKNILWNRLASSKSFPSSLSLLVASGSTFPILVRPPFFVPSQIFGRMEVPSESQPLLAIPSATTISTSALPVTAISHQPATVQIQNTHLEHQAHLEAVMSNMGKSKNGHVCLYCGKLYSRKYGLKIHIRTHTGFKPLHCRICKRPFGDPSNLNKHVRLHSDGNTPYRCDICAKVLVRKRDLDRHIRSRHPNLPSQSRTLSQMSSTVSSSTITSNLGAST